MFQGDVDDLLLLKLEAKDFGTASTHVVDPWFIMPIFIKPITFSLYIGPLTPVSSINQDIAVAWDCVKAADGTPCAMWPISKLPFDEREQMMTADIDVVQISPNHEVIS